MEIKMNRLTLKNTNKAEIYYYDIGDYLSREQKLNIIQNFKSIENLTFTKIEPNEHGDWISKRNDTFSTWIPIEAQKKFDEKSQSFFVINSLGLTTNRDSYIYNYSKEKLMANTKKMIDYFNNQNDKENPAVNEKIINWSRGLKNALKRGTTQIFQDENLILAQYRPFEKQFVYFDRVFNEYVYNLPKLFPTPAHKNIVIMLTGLQERRGFASLMSNHISDLNNFDGGCQCFPLYWYEEIRHGQGSLFGDEGEQFIRHDAVSDFILNRAQSKYGNKVTKENIFYYVYGLLHSKSYRETFAADLKKMLPRIPLVSDYKKFFAFVDAGTKLAKLHLNYENVPPCSDVQVEAIKESTYEIPQRKLKTDDGLLAVAEGNAVVEPAETTSDYEYYSVQQMKFPKKGEKGTILYNHYITLKNIPLKAYDYIVNGKSAVEWIMERYAVTTDKKSGIVNNPNDWAREQEKPRYILDLLLSVINISVQTVDIVNSLPDVDWEKE